MSKKKLSIFDFIDNDIEFMFEDDIPDNKRTDLTNEEPSIWENFDILDSKIKIINNEGEYEPLDFSLPSNFFENMTDLEADLYDDFSSDKLNTLIQIYLTAFQFYLENDPPKAKAYQNRMEYLLSNKETLLNLKKEKNTKNIINSSDKEMPKINKLFKRMKNNYKNKLEDIKKIDLNEIVNDAFNDIDKEKNISAIKTILDGDFKKQNEKWRKKLTKKKIINGQKNIKLFKTPNPSNNRTNLRLEKNNSLFNVFNKKEKLNSINLYYNCNEIDEDLNEENNGKIKIKDDIDINYKNKFIDRHRHSHSDKEIIYIENDKYKSCNLNKINELGEQDKNNNGSCYIAQLTERSNIIDLQNKKENFSIFKNIDNEIINQEKILQENKDLNVTIKSKNCKIINELNNHNNNENNDEKINIQENFGKIELDDDIIKTLNEKIEKIYHLSNIKGKNKYMNNGNELNDTNINSEEFEIIPIKFRETILKVEKKMNDYIINLKHHFYNDIFENFFLSIKELYDLKYKKYIEIKNEYHSSITENEFLLESEENLGNSKKNEIVQIIENLKDELQYQIDIIFDEFNELINRKINEFKMNSFKSVGIQLIEEQLKLDIYSIINESFY